MIQGISLRDLRNAEYVQFSKDVMGIVTLNNIGALDVAVQFAAFQNITNEIEAIFATDQGSDTTPLIQSLDIRRDNAIQGIISLVNAMTFHFDPAINAAAVAITEQLKLYGNGQTGISKQNYMAETASITNIIADWDTKPNLTAAINTLGLAAWKAELNTANQLFNPAYLARTQEIGAANPNTIKDKRLESANLYYALRDRIGAFYTINNAANPWGKTVNEINALIEQYNLLLANRATEPNPEPNPNPPQG